MKTLCEVHTYTVAKIIQLYSVTFGMSDFATSRTTQITFGMSDFATSRTTQIIIYVHVH